MSPLSCFSFSVIFLPSYPLEHLSDDFVRRDDLFLLPFLESLSRGFLTSPDPSSLTFYFIFLLHLPRRDHQFPPRTCELKNLIFSSRKQRVDFFPTALILGLFSFSCRVVNPLQGPLLGGARLHPIFLITHCLHSPPHFFFVCLFLLTSSSSHPFSHSKVFSPGLQRDRLSLPVSPPVVSIPHYLINPPCVTRVSPFRASRGGLRFLSSHSPAKRLNPGGQSTRRVAGLSSFLLDVSRSTGFMFDFFGLLPYRKFNFHGHTPFRDQSGSLPRNSFASIHRNFSLDSPAARNSIPPKWFIPFRFLL